MRLLVTRTAFLFCLLSTTHCHAESLRGTDPEERSSVSITININRTATVAPLPEESSTSISINIQNPISTSTTPNPTNNPDSLLRPVNEESDAPLAALREDGILQYGYYRNKGTYAATGELYEANNLIPDYSYAGYMGGGVALPTYASIPVRITLSASGGDDTAAIQQALEQVGGMDPDERGIRGAVLLKRGRYTTNSRITIQHGGVVLRGEGQGEDGTVIYSTDTSPKNTLVRMEGTGGWGFHPPRADATLPASNITDELLPTGSRTLTVNSVEHFSVGDTIAILKTPNQRWIDTLNTGRYGWKPNDYHNHYEVTIEHIDAENQQLTIDVPLVETIERRFGGAEVYRIDTTSYRIRQAGIENLRLTNFPRVGGRPARGNYNRPYYGVTLLQVEDSWVRDVTVRGVSHGITANRGVKHVTIQDSASRDPNFVVIGGNHYSFNLNDGQGILFQRCWAHNGRHPLVTGAKVPGPNVFLDSISVRDDSDNGPHHRWATGTLYDNTKGKQLHVRNRAHSGTGHGWTGGSQMFWNVDYDQIIAETPVTAMNYAVGAKGIFKTRLRNAESEDGILDKVSDTLHDVAESIETAIPMLKGVLVRQAVPSGIVESRGTSVRPRSIYLQQLRDRLGDSAVDAITVPEQQDSIVDVLRTWDGNGRSPLSAANWEDETIPS